MECWHRERRLTMARLLRIVERLKKWSRRIVFTNGCFDLLHAGHVKTLNLAGTFGDVLIVGLNSDASVRRLKGPDRPINRQEHRAAVLAALTCVDYVTIFEEDVPIELIKSLRPHVIVKGGDYRLESIVGQTFVRSYGGEVCAVPLIHGLSTTALVKACRKSDPQEH